MTSGSQTAPWSQTDPVSQTAPGSQTGLSPGAWFTPEASSLLGLVDSQGRFTPGVFQVLGHLVTKIAVTH